VSILNPDTFGEIVKAKVLFPVPPVAVMVSTPVAPFTTFRVVTVAVSETASGIV
jgi:hypothetical protein